jgi:hypothetical protein
MTLQEMGFRSRMRALSPGASSRAVASSRLEMGGSSPSARTPVAATDVLSLAVTMGDELEAECVS